MPWKMYKNIMEEVKLHGCPSITIGGHCEPLLDKRLSDMVATARDSGVIDIMINTNATLLTRKIGEKLILAGLIRLRVGFYGATRQTYESVRIGAEFKKVKHNILDFLSLRSEIGSKLPIVRISCVHLSVNDYEIDDFVNYWISKVDYVSIQRYRPHELTEDRARGKLGAGIKKIENIKCSEPWERLYIRGNGDVYPCCHPAIGPLVGNVNRNSIYEIWNSEVMRFLRNTMINGDWDSIPGCKNCMIQNYNPNGF
jgi:radical SAM protein with 4Fe4S-binding SPASM domain